MFNDYRSKNKFNPDMLKDYPDLMQQYQAMHTWEEYEQKPDFSNLTPEEKRMLPDKFLDGQVEDRMDSWLVK